MRGRRSAGPSLRAGSTGWSATRDGRAPGHRPQDRQPPSRPTPRWPSTPSSASTRSPSSTGAFAEHGSASAGGAALGPARQGRRRRHRRCSCSRRCAERDDPRWADGSSRETADGHGGGALRGDASERLPHLPGPRAAARSSPRAGGSVADHAHCTRTAEPIAARRLGRCRRPTARAGRGHRGAARRRCSSSPAPARARPRRWRRGWSGWSPTASSTPDQVLGLTFTRKAAGELAERVGERLRQLRARGLWRPATTDGAETLGEPTVSTYHSYAGRARRRARPAARVRARRRGCSPRPPRWQLADEVVARLRRRHDAGRPRRRARSPTRSLDAGRRAAPSTCVDPGAARADLVEPAARRSRRPPSRRAGPAADAAVGKVLADAAGAAARCCRWSRATRRASATREALDFGDQMALAARLARDSPRSARPSAARFRVGAARRVPGHQPRPGGAAAGAVRPAGHPVTAVGDPCQSIYGWRGASAARWTGSRRRSAAATATRRAGALADELAQRPGPSSRWPTASPRRCASRRPPVDRALRPGARAGTRGRGAGVVPARRPVDDEAATAVAAQRRGWRRPGDAAGRRPAGGAVPAAHRSSRRSRRRCGRAGCRSRWSASAGCWTRPRSRRRRAAAGARRPDPRRRAACGCSPGPLAARRRATSTGWAPGHASARLADGRGGRGASRGAGSRGATVGRGPRRGRPPRSAATASTKPQLVEALDDLAAAGLAAPRAGTRGGRARLRRSSAGSSVGCAASPDLPLPDLVADTERTLGLDVEVAAAARARPAAARAHLDAFADVAAGSRRADRPTLRRLPGLARRGRGRGARAWTRATSSRPGRGPGAHRARGQGPGVGRRRGAGAGRGHLPRPTRGPRTDGDGGSAPSPTSGWSGGLRARVALRLRGDHDGLPGCN